MDSITTIHCTLLFALMLVGHSVMSQQREPIHWLTFEQLDDSLKVHPKKVLINVYADLCTYCRKMDKETFKTNTWQHS